MNTNQTFSFSRLGMLFKKDFIEHHRQFLLAAGFVMLLLSVLNISISINYSGLPNDANFNTTCIHVEKGWVIAAFIIFGMIAGASLFTTLKNPAQRLSTLMVPASQLEKFTERWLLVVPGYIVIFLFVACVADLVRVGFCEWIMHRSVTAITLSDIFDGTYSPLRKFALATLLFLAMQSFFVLGSVVWQKLAMVKTFWVLVAIGFVYIAVGAWIMDTFHRPGTSFIQPWLFESASAQNTLLAVIALFNYSVAYLRLRESEIINRW